MTTSGVSHSKVSATADGTDSSKVRPSDWNDDHVISYVKPTGLTGATTASRYVGATAGGAPTSGTFALGDYVIDQTGKVWICIGAGTPGIWQSGSSATGTIGVKASRTTDQTGVVTATDTPIVWNAADFFDTDGFHDPTTNASRITIPAGLGGKYLVTAGVIYDTNSTGQRQLWIRKNGSLTASDLLYENATASDLSLAIIAIIDLAAGDYIEAIAWQNSGTNRTLTFSLWGTSTFTAMKLDSGRVGQGIGVRVSNNAAQSVPNTTDTILTFNTEAFDTDGFHDLVTNTGRLTIPTGLSGKYVILAHVEFNANATGVRQVQIRKNGSTPLNLTNTLTIGAGADTFVECSAIADLASGDYVESLAYQGSGGSLNSNSGGTYAPSFSLMRLDSGGTGSGTQAMKDVKTYGASGNGVTDDTAAIQAAIDACVAVGGGTVYFPSGSYSALSLVLKSNVTLLGYGGATLVKRGGSGATVIVNATGTLGTTVSLNANATFRATTVTAATNPAGLVAGDWVMIRDATYQYSTSGRNQEINRIASVSGAGPFTFTLTSSTIGSYATASTAEILKLTPVVNASIQNLTMNIPLTTSGGHVWADLVADMTIRNCTFTNPYQLPAILIDESVNVRVLNNNIRDGQDQITSPDYGIGIIVSTSAHHVYIANNYIESIQENANSNNARYVVWDSNEFRYNGVDALNAHGTGVHHLIFRNNTIVGSRQFGIGVYSVQAAPSDIEITGNHIRGCAATSLVVVGASTLPAQRILIANNHISGQGSAGDGAMIEIATAAKAVEITGNMLDGTGTAALSIAAIYIGSGVTADVSSVMVRGNTFTNHTGYSALSIGGTTRCVIAGNIFEGNNFENIKSIGTNTALRVLDNVADSTSGTSSAAAGEEWRGNQWNSKPDRATGSAAIATGATIAHGLYATPTKYGAQSTSSAGAYISSVDATNLTLTFIGGGTQTIKWWAEV